MSKHKTKEEEETAAEEVRRVRAEIAKKSKAFPAYGTPEYERLVAEAAMEWRGEQGIDTLPALIYAWLHWRIWQIGDYYYDDVDERPFKEVREFLTDIAQDAISGVVHTGAPEDPDKLNGRRPFLGTQKRERKNPYAR